MKNGIQKRGKASYRISVWYTDPATRKKRLHTETVKGSEDHARARKLEIETEKLQHQFSPPERMPLAEFLDRWLLIEGQKKSPKTYQGYESICRAHLKPLLGEVPVSKLNEFLIEGAYSKLLGQGGRKDDRKGAFAADYTEHPQVPIHGAILRGQVEDAKDQPLPFRHPARGRDR